MSKTKTLLLAVLLLLTINLFAGERVTLDMAKQVALNDYRISVIAMHYQRGLIADPYKEWDLPDEVILKKFTIDSLVHEGNVIRYFFNVTGNGSRGGCIDIAANTSTGGVSGSDGSYYYGKSIYEIYLKNQKKFEEAKANGKNPKMPILNSGMIYIGAYLKNYSKELSKDDKVYWETYLKNSQEFKKIKRLGFDEQVQTSKAKIKKDGSRTYPRWYQGSPFWRECPITSSGDTTLVGCVALAMGSVMSYHGYPNKGLGSVSYSPPGFGNLSSNLSAHTYDFSTMNIDSLPSYNAPGVGGSAFFLKDVGYAVKMIYGTDGSSPEDYNRTYYLCNFSPVLRY